jgi:hypothetical protein
MWFHDHFMHHTGANVYKGIVGLYPIYDPVLDPGDERLGLRTAGRAEHRHRPRRLRHPDRVLRRRDRRRRRRGHRDAHNGCGEDASRVVGQALLPSLPNHGFVGDVFTTNCVAYPVLHVKRRKYRTRFLGASISRIYELSWQTDGDVVPAGLSPDDEAGTWRIRRDSISTRPPGIPTRENGRVSGGTAADRSASSPSRSRPKAASSRIRSCGTRGKSGRPSAAN